MDSPTWITYSVKSSGSRDISQTHQYLRDRERRHPQRKSKNKESKSMKRINILNTIHGAGNPPQSSLSTMVLFSGCPYNRLSSSGTIKHSTYKSMLLTFIYREKLRLPPVIGVYCSQENREDWETLSASFRAGGSQFTATCWCSNVIHANPKVISEKLHILFSHLK